MKHSKIHVKRQNNLFAFAFGLNICLLVIFSSPTTALSQALENVVVETYYITDTNDEDISGSDGIEAGMITYRVFVEVCEDCRLISLFSNEIHPLEIQSTESFYNSQFGTFFGHNNNSQLFPLFDSPALDSYLTLGAASNSDWGIPKEEDNDGSIWEGRTPPDGLTNSVSEMGTPLFDTDGFTNSSGESTEPEGWNPPINTENISSVFGSTTSSNAYISIEDEIRSLSGVVSQTDSDLILIGQFTTAGEFSFKLNIAVLNELGEEIFFVPDSAFAENEFVSPLLSFPLVCGCTDPDFLEYDPSFACSEEGACITPIVFGCLNPEACNYDTLANFDVPELCCFPDSCQGLDPSLICPSLSNEVENPETGLVVFPNPSYGTFHIRQSAILRENQPQLISIFDLRGRKIDDFFHDFRNTEVLTITLKGQISSGTYILRLGGNSPASSTLIHIR